MTKEAALIEFNEIFPREAFMRQHTQSIDHVARAETWGNFTDALCKTGRITLKQYETWTSPFR